MGARSASGTRKVAKLDLSGDWGARKDTSYETYGTYIETRPPEVVANILICLIHQTNYLLDQQLRQLEKAFLQEGGLRERMTRARLSERSKTRRG